MIAKHIWEDGNSFQWPKAKLWCKLTPQVQGVIRNCHKNVLKELWEQLMDVVLMTCGEGYHSFTTFRTCRLWGTDSKNIDCCYFSLRHRCHVSSWKIRNSGSLNRNSRVGVWLEMSSSWSSEANGWVAAPQLAGILFLTLAWGQSPGACQGGAAGLITLGLAPRDQLVSLPWKFGLLVSQLDRCICQGREGQQLGPGGCQTHHHREVRSLIWPAGQLLSAAANFPLSLASSSLYDSK